MPSRNWLLRIQDIINSANSISDYLAEMTFDEFSKNEVLIQAILYDFVLIGEAAIADSDRSKISLSANSVAVDG